MTVKSYKKSRLNSKYANMDKRKSDSRLNTLSKKKEESGSISKDLFARYLNKDKKPQ